MVDLDLGYPGQVLAIQLKWSRIVQVSHTKFLFFKTKLLLQVNFQDILSNAMTNSNPFSILRNSPMFLKPYPPPPALSYCQSPCLWQTQLLYEPLQHQLAAMLALAELHQLAWEAEHEEELEEAHRSGREGFEGGEGVVNTLEYRVTSSWTNSNCFLSSSLFTTSRHSASPWSLKDFLLFSSIFLPSPNFLFQKSHSPPPSCRPHPSRTTLFSPAFPSHPLPTWPCFEHLHALHHLEFLPGGPASLLQAKRSVAWADHSVCWWTRWIGSWRDWRWRFCFSFPSGWSGSLEKSSFSPSLDWSETLQNNSNNLQTDCLQTTPRLNFLHFTQIELDWHMFCSAWHLGNNWKTKIDKVSSLVFCLPSSALVSLYKLYILWSET